MSVAVIGGGILGALIAAGLAQRGLTVDLIERRSTLLSGASAAGEGKIHLGLVYALGRTATAETMLRSALGFDRAVDRLLGRPLDWDELRGPTFRYVVAPDSLVDPEGVVAHGERLEELRSRLHDEDPTSTYLGRPLHSCRLRPVDGRPRWFDVDERCVDVPTLGRAVTTTIEAHRSVTIRCGTTVDDVEATQTGWRLTSTGVDGGVRTTQHPVVVNCAWEDAARLDRAAGHPRVEPPNLRLRTYVHGRVESPPMAVTIVHGPYGDLVVHRDGRLYASWYPTGLLGFVNADSAPAEWSAALDDPAVRAAQIDATLSHLRAHVPELGPVHDPTVATGVVVARGRTDIDDPTSGLHERHESGHSIEDGWVSVRSTKFTSAPVAALEVVDRIVESSS